MSDVGIDYTTNRLNLPSRFQEASGFSNLPDATKTRVCSGGNRDVVDESILYCLSLNAYVCCLFCSVTNMKTGSADLSTPVIHITAQLF